MDTETFENDGQEMEEEMLPGTIPFPGRRTGKIPEASDVPVSNADDIPLFPDANKKTSRTVAYINVIRQNNPSPGIKGTLKPTSTEMTIYQTFGNGLYTLEARTANHKILRTRENVSISIDEDKQDNKAIVSQGSGISELKEVLRAMLSSAERETARIEALAKESTEQSREQSRGFVEMVKDNSRQSMDRDRQFFAGMNEQSQSFMASILQSNRESFQQLMHLTQEGHRHTMEQLNAMRENERNNNNPMLFVSLLMEGLKLGRDFEGDDKPDWLHALSEGGEMLGTLRDLALLKSGKAPMRKLANPGKPEKVSETSNQLPVASTPVKILSPEEIEQLAIFKRVLRERGIDLAEVLNQNIEHYRTAPDKVLFSEENPDKGENEETENEQTE